MNTPNLDPRIRELMDACGPHGDDVCEPEMKALADHLEQDADAREVFSRSQQLDRSICDAFQDVASPPGFAVRLLDAVGAEGSPPASAQSHSAPTVRTPYVSRRRLLAAAATIAATLVVAVYAAVVWNESAGPTEAGKVAEIAIAWVDDAQQGDWNSGKPAPLDTYPFAGEIDLPSVSPAVRQWQFVRTAYGKAAAYDLTPAGKGFVYQFAIRTDEHFSAPQLLPPAPHQNTQGMCIGVAYRSGFLYVLVVEGDKRRYEELIRDRMPVI